MNDENISLCISCKYQKNCPRNFDITKIKAMHHCNYYFNQNQKEELIIYDNELIEEVKVEIISDPDPTNNIKIFCSKCNKEMDKVLFNNKTFFRCANFRSEKCDLNADPIFISESVLDDSVTKPEFDNTNFSYSYSWDDEIIWIKQVTE